MNTASDASEKTDVAAYPAMLELQFNFGKSELMNENWKDSEREYLVSVGVGLREIVYICLWQNGTANQRNV